MSKDERDERWERLMQLMTKCQEKTGTDQKKASALFMERLEEDAALEADCEIIAE